MIARADQYILGLVFILTPLMALPALLSQSNFPGLGNEVVWAMAVAGASYCFLRFCWPYIEPVFAKAPRRGVRLLISAPLIVSGREFLDYFGHIKPTIPSVVPFVWDRTFILWDRALHFTDPWRLLQPILGQPQITSTLAYSYNLWFLLISLGPLYFAVFVDDLKLRFRFLASFFILWAVAGVYLSTALSSVGPIFLEKIIGDPYFAEQVDYLRTASKESFNLSLTVQARLYNQFAAGETGLGRGISAMPSMHVALAFLCWLAMRRINKYAGWFFGFYCFVIFISSIHLAFHYAVDGYLAAAITYTIWRVVPFLYPASSTKFSHASE